MVQDKFTTSPTPSNIVSAINAMVDDIASKAESNHNHDASHITSGILPVSQGGTTTASNALNNLGGVPTSDVAISSSGMLLNILMVKDESDNLTSIVQANKLS